MSWTSLINHLLHLFLLPLGMGVGFVLFEAIKRVVKGRIKVTFGLSIYAFILLLLGLSTQTAVLWVLHKDGTVIGYALITLVMGSGHFLLTRAWKPQST